jgi:hypothetical protein
MASAPGGARDDAGLRACVAALLKIGSDAPAEAIAACNAFAVRFNASVPHTTPVQDAAARALPVLLARVQAATQAGDTRCADAACNALAALVVGHARNTAAARAAGAVGTVVRQLQSALFEGLDGAIAALTTLVREDEASQSCASEAVEFACVTLRSLAAAARCPSFGASCCTLLLALVDEHAGNRARAVAAGAVTTAVAQLRAQPACAQTQALFCLLLDELAIHDARPRVCGDTELALAIAALRRHATDVGVQRGAIRLVATLVVTDDALAARAARTGAGPLLLAALRLQHPDDADMMCDAHSACLAALRQMCFLVPEYGAAMARVGGVAAVLLVLRPHAALRVRMLQLVGISVLGLLVQEHSPSDAEVEAIAAVCVSAARAHADCPLLAAAYVDCVHKLARSDDAAGSAKRALVRAGCYELVVAAMRRHPRTRDMGVRVACRLFDGAAVAQNEAARTELVPLALACMEAHTGGSGADVDEDALRAACVLMAHLGAWHVSDERTRRRTVAAAIAALRLRPMDEVLYTSCCSLITPGHAFALRLLQNARGKAAELEAMAKAGAAEAFIAALLAHPPGMAPRRAMMALRPLHLLLHDQPARARAALRAGAVDAMARHKLPRDIDADDLECEAALAAELSSAAAAHDAAPCADAAMAASCARCAAAGATGERCALTGCCAWRRRAAAAADGAGEDGAAAGVKLRRCGACRTVAYCSAEHQRAHWAQHKHECPVIAAAASQT